MVSGIHSPLKTYSKMVINGKGKPRFACQVNFEVGSKPLVTNREASIKITQRVVFTKLGRKKDQNVFILLMATIPPGFRDTERLPHPGIEA
jgi:hypothetical protein